MRKVIYSINMSIDGCCDHAAFNPVEEVHDYFTQFMKEGDTLLYGRVTYQLMVPFWPDLVKNPSGEKKLDDFAQAFDAVKEIVVFSTTLEKAENYKTRIVRTDLENEILKLKQAEGRDILLGGVDLASQILALGLIDEMRIVVHPVVVGKGRRLFGEANLPKQLPFDLVSSKTFESGGVALNYLKQ